MKKTVENSELEKSKIHIIVEIIEYMANAVVSKTIIKKTTGNVTVSSFDAGEELDEKITPFDTYIQIIDGVAELTINNNKSTIDSSIFTTISNSYISTNFPTILATIPSNGSFRIIFSNGVSLNGTQFDIDFFIIN